MSESGLVDLLGTRIVALDAMGGNPTIAFLASGIEGDQGPHNRARPLTANRPTHCWTWSSNRWSRSTGDSVFSADDRSMEEAVADALVCGGLDSGPRGNLSPGLVSSRLVDVEGASQWLKGSIVSYAVGGGSVRCSECPKVLSCPTRPYARWPPMHGISSVLTSASHSRASLGLQTRTASRPELSSWASRFPREMQRAWSCTCRGTVSVCDSTRRSPRSISSGGDSPRGRRLRPGRSQSLPGRSQSLPGRSQSLPGRSQSLIVSSLA